MDERLAEFKQLLGDSAAKGPGGSVELLLAQMDEASVHRLRLCSIPHEFDPGILHALAPDLNEKEAEKVCDDFAKLSLVRVLDHTLAIHEESRRYLFNQWLAPERRPEFVAANKALVDYFEKQAARLQEQAASDKSEVVETAGRNRMFHAFGVSPRIGLAKFEELCRERREQLRLGECEILIKLVHEYDQVLDPVQAATVAYHEGKLATDRRQWPRAQDLYNRVLVTEGTPMQLRVKTFCRLGMIHDELRQWDAAIRLFEKGLQLADARPDCARQIIHLHINLGSAYRDSGNLSQAEKFLREGIDLAKETNDLSSVADGYNALGTLFLNLHSTGSAIDAFGESLKHLEMAGDKFRQAQVYNNLGNAYFNQRDWAMSEQFFRQSLEIKRQAGDNAGQALTLTNLVRVYRARDQMPKAVQALEDAAQLFAEVRDDYNVALTKRYLGRIYRSLHNLELSRKAFDEAADLFARGKELQEAENTRQETRALGDKGGLPWWAVTAIVLFALLIVLFVLAIASR